LRYSYCITFLKLVGDADPAILEPGAARRAVVEAVVRIN